MHACAHAYIQRGFGHIEQFTNFRVYLLGLYYWNTVSARSIHTHRYPGIIGSICRVNTIKIHPTCRSASARSTHTEVHKIHDLSGLFDYTRIGSNKGKTPEHNQAKHTKHPHSLEWHNSAITIIFPSTQFPAHIGSICWVNVPSNYTPPAGRPPRAPCSRGSRRCTPAAAMTWRSGGTCGMHGTASGRCSGSPPSCATQWPTPTPQAARAPARRASPPSLLEESACMRVLTFLLRALGASRLQCPGVASWGVPL